MEDGDNRPEWLKREGNRIDLANATGGAKPAKIPLDNRPLEIIHKETRAISKQERRKKGITYLKKINDAVGGNS